FDMIELKFSIEQLTKNCFNTYDDLLILPFDFKFDMNKFILYSNDQIVDLTLKGSQLVSLLIQNRGCFVSIEPLHEV
ncbi:DNA-binding response regulator, partial [Aliarcobacter butzleri]